MANEENDFKTVKLNRLWIYEEAVRNGKLVEAIFLIVKGMKRVRRLTLCVPVCSLR